MPIQWDPAMSTEVAAIDAQHQQLIASLNQLYAAMLDGRSDQGIRDLLTFVSRYADEHFGHEEACFARYACPCAERNQVAHEHFRLWVQRIQAEYEQHGPTPQLLVHLDTELLSWFNGHIRGLDRNLRGCAAE